MKMHSLFSFLTTVKIEQCRQDFWLSRTGTLPNKLNGWRRNIETEEEWRYSMWINATKENNPPLTSHTCNQTQRMQCFESCHLNEARCSEEKQAHQYKQPAAAQQQSKHVVFEGCQKPRNSSLSNLFISALHLMAGGSLSAACSYPF